VAAGPGTASHLLNANHCSAACQASRPRLGAATGLRGERHQVKESFI
jgi:hypothetical protein